MCLIVSKNKGGIKVLEQKQEKKRNYYTVREIRELVFDCQLSVTTIHKLMNTNQIPYVQLCRKRLVPAWWAEAEIKKGRMCSIAN